MKFLVKPDVRIDVARTAEHGLVAGPAPAPRLSGCVPDLPWRTPDLEEHGAAIRERLAVEG